ncbi:MAG: hypothetical protein PHQ65_04755 [Bacteroidales bacterium]|nr:hypothetical protein [Bacteroidales bacterium]MDD3664552.1 hypothetical protein [Bacteroidales bacterium]
MKKNIAKLMIAGLIALAPALLAAQPTPGNNSNGSTVGGNPIGGGAAPAGSGIALLLGLAAAYGGKRVYETRKKLAE